MALEDLNLEFEDENELKKNKGNGAVAVDGDLEFASPDVPESRPRSVKPTIVTQGEAKKPGQVVAPSQMERAKPSLRLEPEYDPHALEISQLQDKMRKVEFDSAVKVATTDYKIDLLTDVMSDIKVLELQVSQMLARMNNKHPDLKPEALMIKKLLADFSSKKRK